MTTCDLRLAIDLADGKSPASSQNGIFSIVRDVQIQRPIAINVSKGHALAPSLQDQTRSLGDIRQMSMAIAKKARIWTAHRRHEQIQRAVAVEVGKHSRARDLVRAA